MTISPDTAKNVEHTVLSAIALDIKMYFYSFMEYEDQAISDIINISLSNRGYSYQITPSIVRCVRSGQSLHNFA